MEPIQAVATRGEMVESRHRVHLAVADAGGSVLLTAGEPDLKTYWRSAAKPFQALPFLAAGGLERFGLNESHVALMCASHHGEPEHVAGVLEILGAIGLSEDALQCGAHYPHDNEAARRLREAGERPRAVHSNCSGKHAGMLAFARLLGADPGTYLSPEHPVQQRILETVAQFSGVPESEIVRGIDGCGVPVFGLPLPAMAVAYARLVRPEEAALPGALQEAAATASRSMQAHPLLVAGTGSFNTDLVESFRPTILAKSGAEGVFCFAHRGLGLGFALKVEDGASRPVPPTVLSILSCLGMDVAAARLGPHRNAEIRNVAGRVVGKIETKLAPDLARALERLLDRLGQKERTGG